MKYWIITAAPTLIFKNIEMRSLALGQRRRTKKKIVLNCCLPRPLVCTHTRRIDGLPASCRSRTRNGGHALPKRTLSAHFHSRFIFTMASSCNSGGGKKPIVFLPFLFFSDKAFCVWFYNFDRFLTIPTFSSLKILVMHYPKAFLSGQPADSDLSMTGRGRSTPIIATIRIAPG